MTQKYLDTCRIMLTKMLTVSSFIMTGYQISTTSHRQSSFVRQQNYYFGKFSKKNASPNPIRSFLEHFCRKFRRPLLPRGRVPAGHPESSTSDSNRSDRIAFATASISRSFRLFQANYSQGQSRRLLIKFFRKLMTTSFCLKLIF